MRISTSNTTMETVPCISYACACEGRLPNTSVMGLKTSRCSVIAFWKGAGNLRKDSGRSLDGLKEDSIQIVSCLVLLKLRQNCSVLKEQLEGTKSSRWGAEAIAELTALLT
jgi:hypothetical protein